MNVNKQISDFLRDAQYKLALMAIEMDEYEDKGDVFYASLRKDAWELDYFFRILYETSQSLEGGFNWLENAGWSNKDILNEIHRLRHKHKMNGTPVLDYGTVTNKIVSFIIGDTSDNTGGESGLPVPSTSGKLLTSTNTGWEEGSLSEYVGMLSSESLNTYFAGR